RCSPLHSRLTARYSNETRIHPLESSLRMSRKRHRPHSGKKRQEEPQRTISARGDHRSAPLKPSFALGGNHNPLLIIAISLALIAATIICYWDSHHADFLTYDDLGYVLENQRVQQGLTLRTIEWAFTSFDSANWHPLTWISHTIDWSLYNKNPSGHHMT